MNNPNRPLAGAIALSLAAAATFSTTTQAVVLNPRGLGQALVYPYYTARDGKTTMLSVVNTTAHGKALKVRFREGYDGREVLAFNVYLSPFDVWTAEVSAAGAGAGIVTNDGTCTFPQFVGTTVPFRTFDFDGSDLPTDGGPTGLERTSEGYFDVIEMGEVTNATRDTLTSITHSNGAPADCSQVAAAWSTGGYWMADPTIDMTPPGGGMYGTESIIDLAQGTMWTLNAEAIDGFSATIQHALPAEPAPDLNTANDGPGAGVVTALVPIGGKLLQATYAKPVDAVSAVLMADSLYNEYVVDQGIGAQSDWVVTFPTKHFYVDPVENAHVDQASNPPFDAKFAAGESCSPFGPRVYDRDESTTSLGFPGVPPPIVLPTLCFETNVLAIKSTTSVLGSHLLNNSDLLGPQLPFLAGHISASLVNSFDASGNVAADPSHALSPSTNGYVFKGMPAIGFVAVNYINAAVTPGVLANYSGPMPHRATVSCTSSTNPQSTCP